MKTDSRLAYNVRSIPIATGKFYYLPLFAVLLFSCKNHMIKTHPLRLKPGADLRKEIEAFAKDNKIEAGWISTCAGSLTQYNIRFANQPSGSKGVGHFEIVSLTGTVSINGSHLHLSISDSTGQTIGGHLLDSNFIYTMAEIILREDDSFFFTRKRTAQHPGKSCRSKEKISNSG